jgi:sialidase-1
VFERTAEGGLRHRAWVGDSLVVDEDLGGTLASAPTVVAWAENQAEVFAIFPDGQLWNRYWDGSSWHPWESLGGELDPASTPACSSWGADRLDVFARGRDGGTWHRWWDGSRWVPWERLPA